MTTGNTARRRTRELTETERRMIEDIAESSKAFGMWPGSPEMIPGRDRGKSGRDGLPPPHDRKCRWRTKP